MSSLRPRDSSGPRSISSEYPAAEKYRDIAELGNGGMGEVYLSVTQGPAGLTGFSKLLVVKRIRQSFADDPDVLNMFLNEARLAARLMHPNVVQTNEVGFDGQRHFIAMEYLDGQSLFSVLRRAHELKVRFPLALHLRVLIESLMGLHYAHELTDFDGTPLGIVHRDATPHNVFITYDGQIKIVDFGIAKVGQTAETRTGVFKGKVPYMAPEQITQGVIDRRCDIFAAGLMLWEAVAQRRMWKGVSDVQIMLGLHSGQIKKLSEVAPDAPPPLVAIVEKALATRAEDRYATAAEMQAELEAFLPMLGTVPTARDVGRWVADAFADSRARIRQAIDSQLKTIKEQPASLTVAPLQLATSAENETPPRVDQTPSHLRASSMSTPASSFSDRRPRSRARLFGILAGVAAGGVMIAFLLAGRARPPASTASLNATNGPSEDKPSKATKSAAAQPATEAPSPNGDVVTLQLQVTPEGAKVTVDDAALTSMTARYRRDGLSHRVRIEAPGYAAKSLWIVFDGNPIALDVKLEKIAAYQLPSYGKKQPQPSSPPPPVSTSVAAQQTAKAPPSTTATPFGELEKNPSKPQPKSSIDTSDPYK